jgi:hypothetical protein
MAANKKSPPHFIFLGIFAIFLCIFFILLPYHQYDFWLALSVIMLYLAYRGYVLAIKIVLKIVFFLLLIPTATFAATIFFIFDFEDISLEVLHWLTRAAFGLCVLGLLLIYAMFEAEKPDKVSRADDSKLHDLGADSTSMKIDLSSDNSLLSSNLVQNDDLNLSKFDEERSYEQAENEVLSGVIRKGLWAKCWAENDGDEKKTKALYIKTRAREIFLDVKTAE